MVTDQPVGEVRSFIWVMCSRWCDSYWVLELVWSLATIWCSRIGSGFLLYLSLQPLISPRALISHRFPHPWLLMQMKCTSN